MSRLRLILGDQLNLNHSWFKETNSSVTYVMMEVKDETNYVLHHAQKIIATFAAMRFFANQLRSKDLEVIYLKINDKENRQNFYENIKSIVKKRNFSQLEYQESRRISVNDRIAKTSFNRRYKSGSS